jgi:hypothetical protein
MFAISMYFQGTTPFKALFMMGATRISHRVLRFLSDESA